MIALFSSHRQTGLKHSNLILFELRLSLKSFWGAKVWNYLTEKSYDKKKSFVGEKPSMNPICLKIFCWLLNDVSGPKGRSFVATVDWRNWFKNKLYFQAPFRSMSLSSSLFPRLARSMTTNRWDLQYHCIFSYTHLH